MAKQSPLQRTSGSLFDVAPKPGEGKGFNSTAPSAYDESDFASKHVTIWAPISAAFGVLSLSALVSLPFLFLSIFAVVAGLIAFYAIFKSGGEASGRGVASAGLILGLATLIGAPTHNYVYRKDFGRQADQFAQYWFESVKDENIALSRLAQEPYWQRAPFVTHDDVVDYWIRSKSGDEEPHDAVHSYLSNPTLLTINYCGDRAKMTRYSVVEDYLSSSKEMTSRIYAVTIDPKTHEELRQTFFINLLMERVERKTPQGQRLVGWKIIMNNFRPLPLDAQGRPYVKQD